MKRNREDSPIRTTLLKPSDQPNEIPKKSDPLTQTSPIQTPTVPTQPMVYNNDTGKVSSDWFKISDPRVLTPQQIIEKYDLKVDMKDRPQNFIIGILDTRIDKEIIKKYTHVNWEFYPSEPESNVKIDGHGTEIAAIIAELVMPFTDQIGTITIWIFNVSHLDPNDFEHKVKAEDVLKGLKWAIERNCDVINISCGFDAISGKMEADLKQQLIQCGQKAHIFISCGNNSSEKPFSKALKPALWANDDLENSFCVSAADQNGNIAISLCDGTNQKCIIAPGFISINEKECKGSSYAACAATAAFCLNRRTDNFNKPKQKEYIIQITSEKEIINQLNKIGIQTTRIGTDPVYLVEVTPEQFNEISQMDGVVEVKRKKDDMTFGSG